MLQVIDHSVAGSTTAQPPGFRPSALRVATHSQQVASLCVWGGGLNPLPRYSRRILQPQPTGPSELEPHHKTHFSVISDNSWGGLTLLQGIHSANSKTRPLG